VNVRVPVSLRRSVLFPLISLVILLVGEIIAVFSHYDRRKKVLTFVSGILFVIAGKFQSRFSSYNIPFTLMRFKPQFYNRREPRLEPRKCERDISNVNVNDVSLYNAIYRALQRHLVG